jgi:hypothetical protein
MEFLNLTLGQFLVVFGSLSAISVALYLLDRTRRRQVVSTLRFWVAQGQPAAVSRRRRIQNPMSLFLQLLGMLLLLLAIAEFQFGGALNKRRDHVLVLDTSAWMGAALPNSTTNTLMDLARANAIGWLRAVPPTDRVLLLRADGLSTPATSWESDHRKVAKAILESQPGATALNLSQNLQFARDLQNQNGATLGEIVYDGPGRISAREANNMHMPNLPAFRVLPVDDAVENAGIRSVGTRRSQTDSGAWEVLVRVQNYGRRPRTVNVTLNYGNAPQGMHPVELMPGAEKETSFLVHTQAAGLLETRLYPRDAFAADNYAALELPSQRSLHVTVYSDQPEALRPALASDSRIDAEFKPTRAYVPANDGLVILDRFKPSSKPQGSSLWIDPPSDGSPIPIKDRITHPDGLQWVPDLGLTQGLRARQMQLESADIFEPAAGDTRIAEVAKGPVAIARGNTLVLGFNPFAGSMRYELAAPLLVGNILRWAAPDVFRDVDVTTQSAGAVSSPLAVGFDRKTVKVLDERGKALPFNIRDRAVQFFAGDSSRVRVISGNSERVYSLTLPEMWDVKWTPPSSARRGIPAWNDSIRRSRSLWPWLALLGAALLLTEWILYGSYTTSRIHIVRSAA